MRRAGMKLIVGLGNPGERYARTRHNVGFMVVEAMARAAGAAPWRRKFGSLLTDCSVGPHRVWLAQPQTFMNDSGIAVGQIVRFHDLALTDCVVVCDDLDLPVGTLRIRASGSAGGHRGLTSVEAHLGSREYPRLRIGIGRSPTQDAVAYVLDRFKPDQRAAIDDAAIDATRALDVWVRRGIDACMNEFN